MKDKVFLDQYGNPMGSMQSQRSQLTNSSFGLSPTAGVNAGEFTLGLSPTYTEFEAMYNGGSDLAVKIVNTPVNEALHYWRKFEHPNPSVIERLEAAEQLMDVKTVVRNALYDSRLYGGSVIFPIFREEPSVDELIKPIDLSSIEQDSISSFRHLDRWSVYKIIEQLYDPLKPDFFAPKYLVIAYGGQPIDLSRVVKIEGEYLPIRLNMNNNWWNKSCLTDVYQLLLQCATIERVMSELSKKATFDVLGLSGLKASVSDPQGQANLQSRMESLNYYQSYYRATVIDAEDRYEHHSSGLEGYTNALEIFYKRLSGSTGIPLSKLVAESDGGSLNGKSQGAASSDDANFASMIEIYQDGTIRPMLEKFDAFFLRNEFGKDYDEIVKDLSWEFVKPQFENVETESLVKSQALERIQAGVAMGILTVDQAKKECLSSEIFSIENIAPELLKEKTEEKERAQISPNNQGWK